MMDDTFVTVQEIAKLWGLSYGERLVVLGCLTFAQLEDATRQARLRGTLRQAAYDSFTKRSTGSRGLLHTRTQHERAACWD